MYIFIKRLLDIILSFFGILVTFPIWIISIIGIKLSDSGPIFYLANRIGKNNKIFRMYKFRSMRVGKANEAVFRGDEDRIFPFGRFMRNTKIDELPQLLNVLLGDMSIVGPRPAAVDQVNITRSGKYADVSKVQVGLTGPSALYDYIYGDAIEDAQEYEKSVLPTRLMLDLVYLDKMGLWFDFKMIWWTIVCIGAIIIRKRPDYIYDSLVKWAKNDDIHDDSISDKNLV